MGSTCRGLDCREIFDDVIVFIILSCLRTGLFLRRCLAKQFKSLPKGLKDIIKPGHLLNFKEARKGFQLSTRELHTHTQS